MSDEELIKDIVHLGEELDALRLPEDVNLYIIGEQTIEGDTDVFNTPKEAE